MAKKLQNRGNAKQYAGITNEIKGMFDETEKPESKEKEAEKPTKTEKKSPTKQGRPVTKEGYKKITLSVSPETLKIIKLAQFERGYSSTISGYIMDLIQNDYKQNKSKYSKWEDKL